MKINEGGDEDSLGIFENMKSVDEYKFVIKDEKNDRKGKTENIKKKYITHQIVKKAKN